jgi:ribosomal-protein-alanine N-acetyltransferase
MPLSIEPMQESDLDEVMLIEQECFRYPWKRSFFADDLQRLKSCLLVAREEERLVGYAVMWLVADEVHLANIAVRSDCRKRGIGTALLNEVIESGLESECHAVYLEVRITNIAAQEFYRKHGFRHSYTRKGYYPDREDALVMERRL